MSKNENENLECAFCKKKTELKELLQVDLIVQDRDSEEMEFIWDQLPDISLEERKNEKYIHMSDLGYKILNVCMECYQNAFKNYQNS